MWAGARTRSERNDKQTRDGVANRVRGGTRSRPLRRRRSRSRNCTLVSFARASSRKGEQKRSGEKREREREREKRGRKHTRVIPANFREIALTSFSRGHTAIATLPPVRPGSILRLTQQRISPTRQRILLLVTVSEYRGYRRNFRPRRIYRARARRRRRRRQRKPGRGFTAHVFASEGSPSLSLFLAPVLSVSLDGVILAEETVPVRNETG